VTCFRSESNRGPYGLLTFLSAALSTTELWWRMNHRKSFRTLYTLPTYKYIHFNQHSCVRGLLWECHSIRSGASGLAYYCTSICVRFGCTRRASCVDSKPKKKKNSLDFHHLKEGFLTGINFCTKQNFRDFSVAKVFFWAQISNNFMQCEWSKEKFLDGR